MSYRKITAATTIPSAAVTTVDCQKQVRTWRILRSVMALLIPTCNCNFLIEHEHDQNPNLQSKHQHFINNYLHNHKSPKLISGSYPPSSSTVTGTIFGYRRGKISFCIQKTSKSPNPTLLLEFSVPTAVLAREMRGGVLRIVLKCNGEGCSPMWDMYCNGRKVGNSKRRRPTKEDAEALNVLRTVTVGAGVVRGKELEDDELMYLRANFRRVSGSKEFESFHLIDPDGNIGQELSIFLFRSPAASA